MKKLIVILEQIPQWYGCGIILLYSLLLAEFFSALHDLTPYNNDLGGFLDVYYKINYISTIVSSIIIWIIMSLLFHLTTLLFNGCALFARFFIYFFLFLFNTNHFHNNCYYRNRTDRYFFFRFNSVTKPSLFQVGNDLG